MVQNYSIQLRLSTKVRVSLGYSLKMDCESGIFEALFLVRSDLVSAKNVQI